MANFVQLFLKHPVFLAQWKSTVCNSHPRLPLHS